MPHRPWTLGTVAFALFATAVLADEPGAPASTSPEPPAAATAEADPGAPPAAEAAGASGLVVGFDPQARRMVEPAAERVAELYAELQRRLADKAAAGQAGPLRAEPESVTLPNGAVRMRVTVDMMSLSLARLGADGKLVQSCVDGPEAAVRVLDDPAGPATE